MILEGRSTNRTICGTVYANLTCGMNNTTMQAYHLPTISTYSQNCDKQPQFDCQYVDDKHYYIKFLVPRSNHKDLKK